MWPDNSFMNVHAYGRTYMIVIYFYVIITVIICLWLHLIWEIFWIQVEPIRNMFAALFLASIGMLIHVHFLWNHVDILLASVILVVIVKTVVISAVVKGFGYNNKTSLLVSCLVVEHLNFLYMFPLTTITLVLEPCRSVCLWHK